MYQFLSGVPVSPATRFLSLRDVDERRTLEDVLHYMHYALAAYGWPMFLMTNAGCGLCRILPSLRYVLPFVVFPCVVDWMNVRVCLAVTVDLYFTGFFVYVVMLFAPLFCVCIAWLDVHVFYQA